MHLVVCLVFFMRLVVWWLNVIKINCFEKKSYFRSDQDQARHFVGPDLGPNCLQRLSADDTSRQRIKVGVLFTKKELALVTPEHELS